MSACLSPLPTGSARTQRVGRPTTITLSHVFLTCPLASQVWSWLGTVWESVTGHRFPMSVAVLLADDRRPWRPTPDPEALWVRLRLLCVAALWKAHCRRHHGNRMPLVTVVAGLVTRVRELMARDAALVTPDGPLVDTVGGDTVSTPLPALTREAFYPAGAIGTPSAPGPRPLQGPSST
jgi:hypothetical protein